MLADLPALPSETRLLDDLGYDPPMFTMVQKPVEVPQNVHIGQQEVRIATGLSDPLNQKLLSLSEILLNRIKREAEIAKTSTLHLSDLFQQSKQSSHVCVLDCIQNANGLALVVQALDRKVDDIVSRHELLAHSVSPLKLPPPVAAAMEQQRWGPVTNVLKPVEVPQLALIDQREVGIASRPAVESLESLVALPAPDVVPLFPSVIAPKYRHAAVRSLCCPSLVKRT